MASTVPIIYTVITLVLIPIFASLMFTVQEHRKSIENLKKDLKDLRSGQATTAQDMTRLGSTLSSFKSEMKTLKKKLAEVEEVMSQLKENVTVERPGSDTVNERIDEVMQKIGDQSTWLNDKSKVVDDLKLRVEHQASVLSENSLELESVKSSVESVDAKARELHTLTGIVQQQGKDIDQLKGGKSRLGFTAYSSVDIKLQPNQRVIFDQTISNMGSHYSTQKGTFVCPVTGFYYFSVTSFKQNTNQTDQEVTLQLMKASQPLLSSTSGGSLPNQGSISMVTECQAGEEVWVRCTGTYLMLTTGLNQNIMHSFVGFLL